MICSFAGSTDAAIVEAGSDVNVLFWGGQPTPDGTAHYASFSELALNDAGTVAVVTQNRLASGAPGQTIVQGGNEARRLIAGGVWLDARSATMEFESFATRTQSQAGHVAFFARIQGPSLGGVPTEGIYRGGTGGLVEIARGDVSLNGLNGPARLFDNGGCNPTINSAGRVGFSATHGPSGTTALYLGSVGGLEVLARTEPAADDLAGRVVADLLGGLSGFGQSPAINTSGEAALAARTGQRIRPNDFVLRTDAVTTELDIAFGPGNPAFDDAQQVSLPGVGTPATGGGVALNDAGQVVVELFDPTSSSVDLVRLNPTGGASQDTVTVIAAYGAQSVAGTDRVLMYGMQGAYALNNPGQVVFVADTRTSGQSNTTSSGLFLFDELAGVRVVALGGQAVPGGGTLDHIGFTDVDGQGERFAINDPGQVAFSARIDTEAGDTNGLFVWDAFGGLREIARLGDSLFGAALTDLGFNSWTNERSTERSGLNAAGEVAFSFALADGRSGVAVWSEADRITGDYDDSGVVEQADLDLVLTNWGIDTSIDEQGLGRVPIGWIQDLPVGVVDQAELDRVLTNWGSDLAPVVIGIPEPGLVVIGIAGGVIGLRRRSVRR